MSAISAPMLRSIPRRIRESKQLKGLALISPTMLYLTIFMLLPLLLVIVVSLLTRGTYGNIVYKFNLGNYSRLIDPIYFRVLGFSVWTAALTTLITLLVGYPLAYFIARVPEQQRSFFLFLIMVPFWTNFIIRIYAWIMILRTEGLLNNFLLGIGIIQRGADRHGV
jgi:spermidine/putrescine transport system permease protein